MLDTANIKYYNAYYDPEPFEAPGYTVDCDTTDLCFTAPKEMLGYFREFLDEDYPEATGMMIKLGYEGVPENIRNCSNKDISVTICPTVEAERFSNSEFIFYDDLDDEIEVELSDEDIDALREIAEAADFRIIA